MTPRYRTWRDVAPKVKEAVARRFPSQRVFAERLGQSQPIVSLWLSGARSPRFDMALKVLELAGVDFTEIFGPPPPAKPAAPKPPPDLSREVAALRQIVETLSVKSGPLPGARRRAAAGKRRGAGAVRDGRRPAR